jgi:hypothetical protein
MRPYLPRSYDDTPWWRLILEALGFVVALLGVVVGEWGRKRRRG